MVQLVYFSAIAMCLFGAFAGTAFVSSRRLPGTTRRYGYAAVLAATAMCLAYVGMTTVQAFFEQQGFPLLMMELSRFVGYTLMWLPIIYVASSLSGIGRGLSVALFVAIVGQLWMTFVAWQTATVPQWVVLLSPGLLLVGSYLLYAPITRAATAQSKTRATVYNKLKHTMFLGWFGQVMTVVVHPGTLGWTTVFTDWVTIMYVELLLVGAFVAIVFNNADAFDDIVGDGTEDEPEETPRAERRSGRTVGA